MQTLKEVKWQSVICSIVYIGIGAMLLLFPRITAKTVCFVAGGSAIIVGFIIVCIYLFRDAKKNAYRNDFVCGLLAILLGLFVFWKLELVLGLIPFVLGIAVMVSGFIKLQNCIDVRRMGYGNGLSLFILSLINFIIGIILFADPFGTTVLLSVIIGLALVFCGISDLSTAIYLAAKVNRGMEQNDEEKGRNNSMNILSPSILSADFCVLGEQIQKVERAGAQYLHIDVMDGKFVPSISYGMPVIKSIRKASKAIYDVHLMIEEPERYIEEFVNCGADSVTFHLEATEKAGEIIEKLHLLGKKAGISIKPGTDVSKLIPYLDKVDMILIMTVEPGFGGQSYIEASTERIRAVKKMIESGNHHVDIEVDGGINRENLHTVLEAGANVIVAGSAIFRGNIEENTVFFLEEMR